MNSIIPTDKVIFFYIFMLVIISIISSILRSIRMNTEVKSTAMEIKKRKTNKIWKKLILTLLCGYAAGFSLVMVISIPIIMFTRRSLSVDVTSTLLSSLPVANTVGIAFILLVVLLFAVMVLITGTFNTIEK